MEEKEKTSKNDSSSLTRCNRGGGRQGDVWDTYPHVSPSATKTFPPIPSSNGTQLPSFVILEPYFILQNTNTHQTAEQVD